MKRLFHITMLMVILCAQAQIASAWSRGGHTISAIIAVRELGDDIAPLMGLMRQHPSYAEWEGEYPTEGEGIDFNEYIFMKASIWPDQIRGTGHPHDHPNWHYVNYPFKPQDGFPDLPSITPNDDILVGIQWARDSVMNTSKLGAVRAIYLAWLIHLIGDVHQPLHCAAWKGKGWEKLKRGDEGGNKYFVINVTGKVKLHSYWDQLLGATFDASRATKTATRLIKDYPRKKLPEMKDTTVVEWSLESRALALKDAYRKGNVKGTRYEKDAKYKLTDYYKKKAAKIAEERVALSGYRMGDFLRELGV